MPKNSIIKTEDEVNCSKKNDCFLKNLKSEFLAITPEYWFVLKESLDKSLKIFKIMIRLPKLTKSRLTCGFKYKRKNVLSSLADMSKLICQCFGLILKILAQLINFSFSAPFFLGKVLLRLCCTASFKTLKL